MSLGGGGQGGIERNVALRDKAEGTQKCLKDEPKERLSETPEVAQDMSCFPLVSFHMAVGQNQWDPILGYVNSPPILEPIAVGIGMFTGWILTHGHISTGRAVHFEKHSSAREGGCSKQVSKHLALPLKASSKYTC